MPRGRGKRGSKKGLHRHFTNNEQMKEDAEKERKNKEWRARKGIESGDSGSDKSGSESESGSEYSEEGEEGDTMTFDRTASRDLPKQSSSESESSSEDEEPKQKGVGHLIEQANPNRAKARVNKKVTELGDQTSQLSRREREEIQKQQSKAHYQKLHSEGKTEEARADLARLALVRQRREEIAKKKEKETQAKDADRKAAEDRLLARKKAMK